MADKKFGQKEFALIVKKKFYDLNKNLHMTCPCGEKEILIDDELSFMDKVQVIQQQNKSNVKDEFADIENTDSSLDDEDENWYH